MQKFENTYIRDDELYIHVDSIITCNYSCYYCETPYVKEYKLIDFNKLLNFIDNLIKKTDFKKIHIVLINGEPTLDKNLLTFSDKLASQSNRIEVIVYSNFSSDLDVYKRLLRNNNKLILTYHSNQLLSGLDFISKLNILSSYLSQIEAHVMYDKKFLNDSVSIYKKLKSLYPDITYLDILHYDFTTKYIQNTSDKYSLLDLEQFRFLTKDYPKTVKIDDSYYSIPEVQTMIGKNMSFDDFKCNAGKTLLVVDVDGNIFKCYKLDKNKIGTLEDFDFKFSTETICNQPYCDNLFNVNKWYD